MHAFVNLQLAASEKAQDDRATNQLNMILVRF